MSESAEERRARHRAYYQANKERILARQAAQKAANRDEILRRKASYYQANREQILERMRADFEVNREAKLEAMRAYRARPEWAEEQARRRREWKGRNRERVAEYERFRTLQRRGVDAEIIDRDQVWDADAGICRLCGSPADPRDWHIEHIIPLSKGGPHRYFNVAVSHPACNLAKGASDPRDPASPYRHLLAS